MSNIARVSAAVLALGLLVAPLAGCAPEPGASGSEGPEGPGSAPTEKQEPEGGSWPAENPDEVYDKHQEIPEDFPEAFVIPEGAEIDNVGTRGHGTWYLVLRAADEDEAAVLWDEVVAAGSFVQSDGMETTEGGIAATLSSGELTVDAMTLPEADGTVLVSYDITSAVL